MWRDDWEPVVGEVYDGIIRAPGSTRVTQWSPYGPTPVSLERHRSCRRGHARPRGDAGLLRGGGEIHPPGARQRPLPRPPRRPHQPPPARELTWSGKVDMALWSAARVKAYKVVLQQPAPPTLAILRIPRIKLEVPVYDGTSDADPRPRRRTHRGHGPARDEGNVGIAAHRDGFFRVLKDLKEGDALVLDTPVATEQYRVEWIRITTPEDVSVIEPTPGPAVTLVGCYPFYHVGPAPQRFIVRAVPAA